MYKDLTTTEDIMNRWGNHLPMLLSVIGRTWGPILEYGMGNYSTPILHEICKAMDKKLISIEENDYEWFKKFEKYDSEFHDLHFLQGKELDDVNFNNIDCRWGVVLIDHDNKRRAVDLLKYKNTADFIVMHDTELGADYHLYNRNNSLEDVFNTFKYRYNYRKLSPAPNTTVVSNFYDLEFLKGVE